MFSLITGKYRVKNPVDSPSNMSQMTQTHFRIFVRKWRWLGYSVYKWLMGRSASLETSSNLMSLSLQTWSRNEVQRGTFILSTPLKQNLNSGLHQPLPCTVSFSYSSVFCPFLGCQGQPGEGPVRNGWSLWRGSEGSGSDQHRGQRGHRQGSGVDLWYDTSASAPWINYQSFLFAQLSTN